MMLLNKKDDNKNDKSIINDGLKNFYSNDLNNKITEKESLYCAVELLTNNQFNL